MNTSFARKPFLPSERSRPTDSLFRTATALYLAHARRQSVAETIPEAGGAKSDSLVRAATAPAMTGSSPWAGPA